jgi:hypothetical protein
MVMTGRNTDTGEVDITIDTTEFNRAMREVGEAMAAIGQVLVERWHPIMVALAAAVAPIYCLDPGGPYSAHQGEPIVTEADARAALAHAAATVMWPARKIPKRHRRYAKGRYLACRRILGAAALRDVATNQFLST